MTVASELTRMSLAAWARQVGVHPMHIHGVSTDLLSKNRPICEKNWQSKEWQAADMVSRDEVFRTIRSAEDDIESILGYHLLPAWDANERIMLQRYYKPEQPWFGALNIRGYRHGFNAKWGQFITAGQRAKTAMAEATAITWSTADAALDWKYWATVTVPVVTAPDLDEVHVYYPGKDANDYYEIRPITVTLNDDEDEITIRFRRELTVLEDLETSYSTNPKPIRGEVDANFLATVDVYRVYNDPSVNATLLWDGRPGCNTCTSDTGECASCGSNHQSACISATNPKYSALTWTPATYADGVYTDAEPCIGRTPDALRLYYKSGLAAHAGAHERGEIDPRLARAVTLLSVARLTRTLCGCMTAFFQENQRDMRQVPKGESAVLGNADKNNPFGTRRGAVEAWRIVSMFPDVNQNRGVVIA